MPKTTVALPRVALIVPVSRQTPFNDPAWLFEPKYDGFRSMVYLTRRSCSIYSKRGNRFSRPDRRPQLVRAGVLNGWQCS